MNRAILFSLVFLLASCSEASDIDGQYNRINAPAFEVRHGMAKGLLIEDGGRKAVLQHSWGNDVLDVKKDGNKLVVLEDGQPEYIITFKNGKAVIAAADTSFPTNSYEFTKGGKQK